MSKKERKMNMLVPTIIMGVAALILLVIAYTKGRHMEGLGDGIAMFLEIVPLLIFAFIMAGMIRVLLPQEMVANWVGAESGFRGILIGTLAGAVTPGGPYVSMPIAAGLLRAGAGMGTMVAFLTAWSIWAVARLPLEVGIMGWKFTGVRIACSFFFPPIAGFLAQVFFSGVKP
ncbi:MAG: permease [Deltaproteobacteria bacterium]|uniref:Permease n=1 Tax=Candidatus Zymogenus saltonus TaxID=2844893 RepID=A0A9D8KCZ7_9DELT|nr:permease [Candidatus Zymogenus saltonus]